MTINGRIRIRNGEIEDPRRIDIEQLHNMGKNDLIKECEYLMKKRVVLEDLVKTLQDENISLHENIKLHLSNEEKLTLRIQSQQTITSQLLERLNSEKEELSQEIVRLKTEQHQEMNNCVGLD